MCGFAAEVRFDGRDAAVETVARMAESLARRGPDAAGSFAQGRIALAHRRLKIMDLSERAQQPMIDNTLGLGVVFNGAIYNHPELRAELRREGYAFHSDGDTEVILKAYHRWGAACVERFQGMFAFLLWERDSGAVLLARDRLGCAWPPPCRPCSPEAGSPATSTRSRYTITCISTPWCRRRTRC